MADKPQINKDSAVPIYVQIVNWITSQVTTGVWKANHRLPSEPNLASNLGVSRGSLRKAISLLASKGMLMQVHGRGTFVQEQVLEHSWASRLVSTSEELNWHGIPFTTEVLEKTIIDPPEHRIAELLQLAPGEQVVHLLRRRIVQDEPLVVHQTFFPANKYSNILDMDFTTRTMVSDILEKYYKLQLSKAHHAISAINADHVVGNWLGISIGDPVLYDEHILYDETDHVIEFSKGWFRGDRMTLKTVVYRDS